MAGVFTLIKPLVWVRGQWHTMLSIICFLRKASENVTMRPSLSLPPYLKIRCAWKALRFSLWGGGATTRMWRGLTHALPAPPQPMPPVNKTVRANNRAVNSHYKKVRRISRLNIRHERINGKRNVFIVLKISLKDYGYSLLARFTSDSIVKSEKFLKKQCIVDFSSSSIDNDNLAISYVFGSTDTRAYTRNMMSYCHVLSVMATTLPHGLGKPKVNRPTTPSLR